MVRLRYALMVRLILVAWLICLAYLQHAPLIRNVQTASNALNATASLAFAMIL